jgi:dynein heavy chain
MAQMPEEGRKFTIVDKSWKTMMTASLEDTRALVVTGQPNMLANLKHANGLLEEIQKGLNSYLEVKRLFFPRFFFLSNDELLEILSETKDPLRVQPHLKKCFEGIAKLKFDENKEIHGMISADGEEVPFVETIIPADAKGMVEKWLDQVGSMMIKSLRSVTEESVKGYETSPRIQWVQEWPGQVVLAVSSIFWTKAVSEAILTEGGLSAFLAESNKNIDDIVELVRGKLSKALRVTLGALTVLDVHARDVVAELAELNVSDINDFKWLSQLRYFWEKNEASNKPDQEDVVVKMITARTLLLRMTMIRTITRIPSMAHATPSALLVWTA